MRAAKAKKAFSWRTNRKVLNVCVSAVLGGMAAAVILGAKTGLSESSQVGGVSYGDSAAAWEPWLRRIAACNLGIRSIHLVVRAWWSE